MCLSRARCLCSTSRRACSPSKRASTGRSSRIWTRNKDAKSRVSGKKKYLLNNQSCFCCHTNKVSWLINLKNSTGRDCTFVLSWARFPRISCETSHPTTCSFSAVCCRTKPVSDTLRRKCSSISSTRESWRLVSKLRWKICSAKFSVIRYKFNSVHSYWVLRLQKQYRCFCVLCFNFLFETLNFSNGSSV